MENMVSLLQQLTKIKFTDLLDILVVAFLIYKLFPLLRTTGTSRVAKIVVAVVAMAVLSEFLHLYTLSFLFSKLLEVGLIAAVVLFQPELRRMVDHVARLKFSRLLGTQKTESEMLSVINQTVSACEAMSREKVGALIVFARESHLDDYFKTGTMIDGKVSEQLLRNLFFPKASLHDGAVVICDGKVTAAGCVLPLSSSEHISADLGTRHRAAVGVSEVTDAVTVVVSEETGAISVAVGGMLKRHLAPQTLEKLLRNELLQDETRDTPNFIMTIREKLKMDGKGEQDHEK